MIKHLVLSFALLALTAPVAANSLAEDLSVMVRVDSASGATGNSDRTFKVVPGQTVVVRDLLLADHVEGAQVELVGGTPESPAYRLQLQYETSVTITKEGPHLDLLDWKHHTPMGC